MPRVIHFEIPAEKPEELAEFYTRVFGWSVQKWAGPVDYWLVSTGAEDRPGINGGIARKRDRPASGVLVTAEVDSVDACLKEIVAAGGTVVVPKGAIPGVGYQAHIRDRGERSGDPGDGSLCPVTGSGFPEEGTGPVRWTLGAMDGTGTIASRPT